MPEYINRTIWFDTSSRNIRLYFNLQHDQDPNLTITSAVIKLHLKSREGNNFNAYVLDSDIYKNELIKCFISVITNMDNPVKPVLSRHSKRPKFGFQDRLSLNAGLKYCRMLQESILQYF